MVMMYADIVSEAMQIAIEETKRRREIQEKYNQEHGIVPKTIEKAIKDVISNEIDMPKEEAKMSKKERQALMIRIEEEMKEAAKKLDFERAMELRNILFEMKSE